MIMSIKENIQNILEAFMKRKNSFLHAFLIYKKAVLKNSLFMPKFIRPLVLVKSGSLKPFETLFTVWKFIHKNEY